MAIDEFADEKTLIKACVKGNKKAQFVFYKKFYGKMMAVCQRYARNDEEAKDIFHEAMMKVFTNLPKYQFSGSLEGWIRRIMINTSIDWYRKNKNTFGFVDDEEQQLEDTQIAIDDMVNSNFNVKDIMRAIQQLTPAYKAVFNLYVVEGYSHKEIAEMLQINIGTSKSNLAKAKQKLQKLLLHQYKEYTK
jgi:RNA polymerase sigma-70 factor (ECF subfamily)